MEEQKANKFQTQPAIKGFPELRWAGKRPCRPAQYFPARLRERYGQETEGWTNKIFWGDNLQVMGHLLQKFRGKIDLIYLDPPFDSKADYKKKIHVRGLGKTESGGSVFEEKQYGDIWVNGEYLQFMYERLILVRELLADRGSVFLHCDWHKSHYLRCLMDEVFGPSNFINEIVWCYYGPGSPGMRQFNRKHDNIFWYSKSHGAWKFNAGAVRIPYDKKTAGNFKRGLRGSGFAGGDYHLADGKIPEDWWRMAVAGRYPSDGVRRAGYPTEKPVELLERIIKAATEEGDLVADFFMGSGVTQLCAMRTGRRFIGADINLAAVQTAVKRLLAGAAELSQSKEGKYTGLEVYHVNRHEFFRNPVQARELLMEALGIRPLPRGGIWDGELDGRMVKILPVDRIAAKADLEDLRARLPYKAYKKRKAENPSLPVEKITIVCMGHEPGLEEPLIRDLPEYKLDIRIVDILRDKTKLRRNREPEAEIAVEDGRLVIRKFYPPNLMGKLSLGREYVEDWRQLVDSVMIDWDYDGAVMRPTVIDIPEKGGLVRGVYEIPGSHGTIRVKITDLLCESLEAEVRG